jgi:hypothetical protein
MGNLTARARCINDQAKIKSITGAVIQNMLVIRDDIWVLDNKLSKIQQQTIQTNSTGEHHHGIYK